MSRRKRVATVLVVAAVGIGIYFLLRGAPEGRTVTYDLGERHEEVVRLEVWMRLDESLVRHVVWTFPPETAPRRVSHSPTLPSEVLSLRTEVESKAGEVMGESRELDATRPGDVTIYLRSP